MEKCPYYKPLYGVREGSLEWLPYGVCSPDLRVVDCRERDYGLCETYRVLVKRELGGLERKVK